jgi:hypothetical protein
MGAVTNLLEAEGAVSASPEKLRLLLERVALVTRVGSGATLLFTLGRIASSSRWLDEGYSVEITGGDHHTTLDVYAEHGEMRRRVVPAMAFNVPIGELIAAIDDDPSLIGELRVEVTPCKLIFTMRTSGVHERPVD